ncbi:MAG: hypothetical protein LBN98_00605 [Prevotellaceae bacterium]|jgi:hypothetical protein|nr:hypothetical protein [Prevotellaceae bacterium]
METIVPTEKGYNHQHACTKVLGTMNKKLADEPAIGIIDDDKVEPAGMADFDHIKTYKDILKLYKHRNNAHYVIKICPAMERFILAAAQECGVSPTAYNLPEGLDEFKKITKNETSKKNKDLRNFFLVLKQQSERICKLVQWVEGIKANPCNPKIN